MKLLVFDILNHSQNAVFHEDGLSLFYAIKKSKDAGQDNFEVSFKNIRVCTTQFLNASLGKLLMTYGEAFVQKHVTLKEYESVNAFEDKQKLVWENFKAKNQPFIEEAYA